MYHANRIHKEDVLDLSGAGGLIFLGGGWFSFLVSKCLRLGKAGLVGVSCPVPPTLFVSP